MTYDEVVVKGLGSRHDPVIEWVDIRCDEHSLFDLDGFAIDPADGKIRCWAPGAPKSCEGCEL
jgi:hypothetical protein